MQQSVGADYKRVDGPGVEFFEIPNYRGPLQYLSVLFQLRKRLGAAVAPGDAVLCRVPSRLGTDLVDRMIALRRPFGVEVAGDPHDVFSPGAIDHPLRPIFRYAFSRSLRKQCTQAAATSYVTERTLQRRYPPSNLSNSFSVSDVELRSEDFVGEPRTLVNLEASRRPRLLFVGSLAQMYKGLDVLINSLSLLEQRGIPVELAVLGDGQHRATLERRSRALRFSKVSFAGQVPAGDRIRSAMDNATLMVMPSRTEGLPRALIEAMARGLPCVASRVGGIPELLEGRDTFLPDDARALADKIEEVLADSDRLKAMSARNLKLAQQYRPDLLEKRRTEFYRSLKQATELWLAHNPVSSINSESACLTQAIP